MSSYYIAGRVAIPLAYILVSYDLSLKLLRYFVDEFMADDSNSTCQVQEVEDDDPPPYSNTVEETSDKDEE